MLVRYHIPVDAMEGLPTQVEEDVQPRTKSSKPYSSYRCAEYWSGATFRQRSGKQFQLQAERRFHPVGGLARQTTSTMPQSDNQVSHSSRGSVATRSRGRGSASAPLSRNLDGQVPQESRQELANPSMSLNVDSQVLQQRRQGFASATQQRESAPVQSGRQNDNAQAPSQLSLQLLDAIDDLIAEECETLHQAGRLHTGECKHYHGDFGFVW